MTSENTPPKRPTWSERLRSATEGTLEWTQKQLEDTQFAPDDRLKTHPYTKPRTGPLLQGEEACRVVTLSRHAERSQIESTFHTVAFGKHNGRNACLIIVELRFVYNKDAPIDRALVRLNFGTEDKDKAGPIKSVSANDRLARKIEHSQVKILSKTQRELNSQDLVILYPRGTNTFEPKEAYGEIKTKEEEEHYGVSAKLYTTVDAKTELVKKATLEDRWHAQSIKDSDRPCYTWSFHSNDYHSFDNFPRSFMVGAVVEHDEVDFYCDVTVAGRRKKYSDWSVNIDRKACQPVLNGHELLTENMLRNITDSTNLRVEPAKTSAAATNDGATAAVQTTTVHVEHQNLIQNVVQHQNVALLPSGQVVEAPAAQPAITALPGQLKSAAEEERVEPEGASKVSSQ